ncbi:MAG: hypothetical protein ACYC0V_17260 [Armatimonadota bacterium]
MKDGLQDQQTHQTYDEPSTKQQTDSVGGWLAPVIVTLFTIIWCLMIYKLIGDRPVDWKYGVTPYIPGQSMISTQQAPKGIAPKQIEMPSAARNRQNAESSDK